MPGSLGRLCGDPTLYLGALFGEHWQMRPLLPPFVGDGAAVDSLPDPTFGGLLPGQRPGDLRCVVDQEGPRISVAPGSWWPPPAFTSEPVHISVRIQDRPVGASPGSAVDPASISVSLSGFPYGGGFSSTGCSPRLNGIPIPDLGYPGSDVTPRFQMTTAPDGSLLLEADLDVTTTSPAQGCDVTINVTAADAYGNVGHGEGALRIYERGPIFTLSPQSYSGRSPAPLSITVAAPFGDVNLENIQIIATPYWDGGCSDLQVNGQPVSWENYWEVDVAPLLNVSSGPGAGAGTWSGLVSVGPSAEDCLVYFTPIYSDPVSEVSYYGRGADFRITP